MNNRLLSLLLWDIKSHRENIVKAIISISIGLSLVNIVQLYSIRNTIYQYSPELAETFAYPFWSMVGVALYVFGFYIVLSAAHVFRNMRNKQERIAFLVLPTTNSEKFIERVLYITIINAIIYLLGFLISDVAQFLFSFAITPGFHHFIIEATGSTIRDASSQGWLPEIFSSLSVQPFIFFLSFFLWLHSSYVLGGALFRRSPILLTTCVHAIVGIFLTIATTISAVSWLQNGAPFIEGSSLSSDDLFLLFSIPCLLALVFDYWAAYWLFTHTQLSTHKWLNL